MSSCKHINARAQLNSTNRVQFDNGARRARELLALCRRHGLCEFDREVRTDETAKDLKAVFVEWKAFRQPGLDLKDVERLDRCTLTAGAPQDHLLATDRLDECATVVESLAWTKVLRHALGAPALHQLTRWNGNVPALWKLHPALRVLLKIGKTDAVEDPAGHVELRGSLHSQNGGRHPRVAQVERRRECSLNFMLADVKQRRIDRPGNREWQLAPAQIIQRPGEPLNIRCDVDVHDEAPSKAGSVCFKADKHWLTIIELRVFLWKHPVFLDETRHDLNTRILHHYRCRRRDL